MSAADRLNEIEARANAATEGPWYRYGTWPYEVYAPREPDGGPYVASVTGDNGRNESNADFIAHARTDVPYLIGQVRWLLDELSAAVADNEKKDAALRELFDKVAEMGRAQTEAVTKVEAALVALKAAIEDLHDKAA